MNARGFPLVISIVILKLAPCVDCRIRQYQHFNHSAKSPSYPACPAERVVKIWDEGGEGKGSGEAFSPEIHRVACGRAQHKTNEGIYSAIELEVRTVSPPPSSSSSVFLSFSPRKSGSVASLRLTRVLSSPRCIRTVCLGSHVQQPHFSGSKLLQ